jgi:hypothetical protein
MHEIPADLHPACVGISWLLGSWEGVGVGGYPGVDSFQFGQQVTFDYSPGKPFLGYESRSWRIDTGGEIGEPLARESGYWRAATGSAELEVVLTHASGYVEIYTGEYQPAQIELATRGVLRTETANDYRAGHRLYGLVNSRLMWAMDMSARDEPLQPHVSAELRRTG